MKRLDKFAYIPFGVGARRCIGALFAEAEAMAIASIVQRFQVRAVANADRLPPRRWRPGERGVRVKVRACASGQGSTVQAAGNPARIVDLLRHDEELETWRATLETVIVLWIKICATTNLDDAQAALEAGANALGFILTASPRQITVRASAHVSRQLPTTTERIGVVVNQAPNRLKELAERIPLTGFQLQGDEPAEQLPEFRRALGLRKIIKTLQARELLADPARLDAYLAQHKSYDGILLDSGSAAARGGTGQVFDWRAMLPLVERIKEVAPVVIAGGLNPQNVAEAVRLFDPCGVDVVSGVECEPGKKDVTKMRAFVAAARGEGIHH